MRSIVIRKLLLLVAVAATVAATPRRAATAPRVLEPLMGLRWSPAGVGFAPAPADLTQRCPDLVNENYDHQLWVLARHASAGGEVMVVSGRFVPRRPGLEDAEGDLGAWVRVRPDGCAMIAPARDPFAAPADHAPDLSADEIERVGQDAAARYVAAYGGAAGLCAAAKRQGKRLASLPVGLRAAFAARARCLRR